MILPVRGNLATGAPLPAQVSITPARDVTLQRIIPSGGSGDLRAVQPEVVCSGWDTRNVYQLMSVAMGEPPTSPLHFADLVGAPRADRHKLNPTWHPSGDLMIVQVEMDSHPLAWLREKWSSELHVNGLWCDLYAVSSGGTRWVKLTNYSNLVADGAMASRVSHDGTKLLWSRMVAAADQQHPFGQFRLMLADLVLEGEPHLANVRDITPPGANLVEPNGFTLDDQSVLFTGDIDNSHAWGMDIFQMDLATGAVTNLTQSPHWEEHANLSPDGKKLVYMSSEPYLWWFMHTELLMLDLVTGERTQLTRFNDQNAPEYIPGGAMPTRSAWSADGRRLLVTVQLTSAYPAVQSWMLEFAGPCGATP
jgi:hypothetical protein